MALIFSLIPPVINTSPLSKSIANENKPCFLYKWTHFQRYDNIDITRIQSIISFENYTHK